MCVCVCVCLLLDSYKKLLQKLQQSTILHMESILYIKQISMFTNTPFTNIPLNLVVLVWASRETTLCTHTHTHTHTHTYIYIYIYKCICTNLSSI